MGGLEDWPMINYYMLPKKIKSKNELLIGQDERGSNRENVSNLRPTSADRLASVSIIYFVRPSIRYPRKSVR